MHLVDTIERCLLCDVIYCFAVLAGIFHNLLLVLPNLLLVLPSLLLFLPNLLLVVPICFLFYLFWFYLFTSGST